MSDKKKSYRKSQLIAFENVAAGHDGVLSDPSGEIVVKPCKQSEISFYQSVPAHPDFLPLIPIFMGRLSFGSDTSIAQAAETLILPGETTPDPPAGSGIAGAAVIENEWAPSNGAKIQTDMAIVLENVAHGYRKPNILDVKLGARLWADDAPAAKRVKLDKVAEETTSKPLGFRIAGMRTYQGMDMVGKGDVRSDGYRLYDKMYGRGFTVNTVSEGFREYFGLVEGTKAEGPIRKVIKRFIGNLREVEEVMEKEESRMYSASLLFVYEGDTRALQDAFPTEKEILASLENNSPTDEGTDDNEDNELTPPKFPSIQSLKLIDFAHAQWTPGQGPDTNLLHGIRHVIRILSEIAG
ncbi:hypothetical protein P7C71_g1381, partial [Lecanoromycetidae sp. Uapishka_2]